jgi:hypothetical protein
MTCDRLANAGVVARDQRRPRDRDGADKLSDPCRDLVMSEAAFARFVAMLDAPAEAVPAMVEMFRLPRIPDA